MVIRQLAPMNGAIVKCCVFGSGLACVLKDPNVESICSQQWMTC